MTHVGLFEGIGGFSLAARWMGWETLAWCEIDPFCQTALKHHFPNAAAHGDITKTDFARYAGRVDVLTGGFPCQGFSFAGKRLGTDDARYLWPEMLKTIKALRPTWVVGENVAGILTMEDRTGSFKEVLLKVEGRKVVRYGQSDHYEAIYSRQAKMLVASICEDLEGEGYQVQPFIVPAGAVGAPHRRDRIWFVARRNDAADTDGNGDSRTPGQVPSPYGQGGAQEREQVQQPFKPSHVQSDAAHAACERCAGQGECAFTKEPGGFVCLCGEQNAAHAASRAARPPRTGGEVEGNRGANYVEPKSWGAEAEQHTRRDELLRHVAHADGCRGFQSHKGICAREPSQDLPSWRHFPTQPPLCGRDDGLSARLAGITVSRHRRESIKAYGNAVVPQVVFEIFKAIQQAET